MGIPGRGSDYSLGRGALLIYVRAPVEMKGGQKEKLKGKNKLGDIISQVPHVVRAS